MNDDHYSEKSAAYVLNIHPDSLRRFRRQGKITFYRGPTGRISYKFDDLLAFNRTERIAATAETTAEPPFEADPPPAEVLPFPKRVEG